jgi:methionyl-tRNA synthetase
VKKSYSYITTPIYYVNDVPHIGHAYTTLAADTLARFKKLQGCSVKLLTGTDEHGQKVQKSAAKAGISPQEFTDKVSQTFRDLALKMEILPHDFIRTTEERHKIAVRALWEKLEQAGFIYLGGYEGWYSVRDEAFYDEKELIDGKAPTGAEVEWVNEPSYFFKLSAFQDKLLEYYKNHPHFIGPQSRRNEVIKFVEGGLTDLSISRTTFDWGVKVPGDENHVVYVWLDALTNYISALGFPRADTSDFQNYWPESVHIVGKDILRFHAVYWPAFLMAANIPLPQTVYAHGWWTNEGQKISKSLGNTIDPLALIDQYGIDSVRYFLLREVPFGQDGDFSTQSLINRINSDLANSYGNLVQRVLSFINKNCGGILPSLGALSEEDEDMINLAQNQSEELSKLMDEFQIHRYGENVWKIIHRANQYVDEHKPWALKKDNPERMNTVLYVLCEVIRQVAILTLPLLPKGSAKVLGLLNIESDRVTLDDLKEPLKPGTRLPTPEGIFPRV